jgi:hypothetical protein
MRHSARMALAGLAEFEEIRAITSDFYTLKIGSAQRVAESQLLGETSAVARKAALSSHLEMLKQYRATALARMHDPMPSLLPSIDWAIADAQFRIASEE